MKKAFVCAAVMVSLVMLTGCDSAPSKQEVKDVFAALFNEKLPSSWGGSYMGSKLKNMEVLEVQKIGESMKKSNNGKMPELVATVYKDCWPVTVHAKGSAMATMLFNEQRLNQFDKVADFLICKDYHDRWVVEGDMF